MTGGKADKQHMAPQTAGQAASQEAKQRRRERFQKFSAIAKLGLLLVLLIGIPAYLFFFHHQFLEGFNSIQDIYAFILKYRNESIAIYLGLQILQILICIIPGQAIQLAAGYAFHFWLGLALTIVGAALGTVVTYYLARLLGHDAMHMLFGEEKINSLLRRLNSKRGLGIVFLIYLIPGVPKDLCTYAAGLSEMKLKPFLVLSLTGRLPGMMGSLLIGRQIQIGGYTSAAIIGGIAVVLFALGMIFRKPLMSFSDRVYEKLREMM